MSYARQLAMSCDELVGRSIWDEAVPTPLVFADADVLRRNVERMAEAAQSAGVGLRPHAKTHKIAEIARLQLGAGAAGLTVAKLSEAQALVSAGISTSFMVAQPYVGAAKVDAQVELADSLEVMVCIDSVELARSLGSHATATGGAVDVILIVDTGTGRLGVPPERAAGAAVAIADVAGVRFRGIRSHTGQAYGVEDPVARREVAAADAETMVEVAERIRSSGLGCEIVSVGSTPGLTGFGSPLEVPGVTEWRPGNYAFNDRMQLSLGTADLEDCALTVIASVVSAAAPGRAITDAGKKTLTSTLDPLSEGYGLVVGRPDVAIHALSEECGWLRYVGPPLQVGDRLRILPNHACELTNLTDVVAFGSNDRIDGFWEPIARAKVW